MEQKQNPVVSFCILTYNQEDYIAECIKGALNQTYENIEIIISDDNSTDNTWQVINDTVKDYQGPKKIILNRNPQNLRLVPHLNHVVFDLSHGDIIVLEGGDDVSMPNRVELAVSELNLNTSIMAVSGQRIDIDKNGTVIGKSCYRRTIHSLNNSYIRSISFMTRGVCKDMRRTVFDYFGPLNSDAQTEDSTLRFRCLLLGNILESEYSILKYRHLETSLSSSQNIYRLKTDLIVKQLLSDIDLALHKRLISSKLAKRLMFKVKIYKNDRLLAEVKQSKPKLIRAFIRLLQKLNIFMLRFI